MKAISIVPEGFLDLFNFSDYQFGLAHLTEPNSYYEHWFKENNFKATIFDNGAAELGKTINVDDVLERMRAIRGDGYFEVWMPDVLYNKDETLRLSRDFIYKLTEEELNNIALVAIPQGETLKEWLDCYDEFIKWPEVDVICFSKYSVPKCFEELTQQKGIAVNRMAALDFFEKHKMWRTDKPIHLAGADHNIIAEIQYAKKFPLVRSIDSNIAFKLATHGFDVRAPPSAEPKERMNHKLKTLTYDELILVLSNIKAVRDATLKS